MIHPRSLAPLLLLAGALSACGGGAADEPAATETSTEVAVNVRTLTLQPGSLAEYVIVSGPLRPIRGADISSEESGVVDAIPAEKGTRVKKGEPLILLDREVLDSERKAAAASRELAEYRETRMRQLFEAKQISRQEMLTVETDVAEARSRAEVTRLRWERAAVTAPFDGVVVDRYVEIGQFVTAGTAVSRVVDPYTLEVRGAVSEREAAWIRKGAQAAVRLDGMNATMDGRVHWISLEASPTTGKFPVEVRVDNADLEFRPGVVAQARILKTVHEDVVIIPRDAVLQQPSGPVAFVVEENRARPRSLVLGADQGLMTVVTSGLVPGDRLVVRGQRQIHDGTRVDVREQATSPDGSTDQDPTAVRSAGSDAPPAAAGLRTEPTSSGEETP
jgi:membrane fusion protein (multidrug efflux system)